ncbi:MAG: hypothetical protein ABL891_02800 [Burkholderiales bacterium]
MLKWLGGSDKVDHPMAELARAKEIIAAFPAEDSTKAAQDAIHWLESISETEGFKLAPRYERIDMIDAPLKRHAQRLLEQYLALKPQSKFQEGQLWKAATEFWKALGDAYLVCVAQAEADKAAAGAFRKTLPILIARAMRAQMLQIKWILMRYGYVSDSYWYTVARLYSQAESGGFIDEVIDIYGGTHGRSSVRQEFLRALMLGVSSTGGLSPIKQNIAERAIAHFSTTFVSGAHAAEGFNFLFDLNGGVSPARVLGCAPDGARLLYFGAGSALDGVQTIVDAINDTGALLSDINLGPGENIDQMADTLMHLAFNWEKELPARDSERRKVAMTLQITQGFDGVLSMGNQAVTETWVVENASAEGYGVIVPERRGEWLQVGVLIGIFPEVESAVWGAGVVRRVESDARGQRRVGIQIISRAVVPATMCTLTVAGVRGAPQNVILLDTEPSQAGYLLAILRPETFALREALEATRTADGKTFTVRPSGLVESGPDFDRVRFKTA